MREKLKEKKEEKMEEKIKENEEREMKKNEREDVFFEKCLRTRKFARWIGSKCFQKKNPFPKVQKTYRVSIIYMIRIRFFGPRELLQICYRRAQ